MHRVRLVRGDAAALPFPDGSFDFVVSSAVWEHLPDVRAATTEVRRVLRPGGLAIIQIALFPSLQGGHHAEWHSVDPDVPRTIPPWDHLYADHRPFPTFLNQLTEADYRNIFGDIFPSVHWRDGDLRGRGLLTGDIKTALRPHSERDLLLTSIAAWIRR
jgi:ubiquinone/menaquinone biosynthesis C-methylase UbiE